MQLQGMAEYGEGHGKYWIAEVKPISASFFPISCQCVGVSLHYRALGSASCDSWMAQTSTLASSNVGKGICYIMALMGLAGSLYTFYI